MSVDKEHVDVRCNVNTGNKHTRTGPINSYDGKENRAANEAISVRDNSRVQIEPSLHKRLQQES